MRANNHYKFFTVFLLLFSFSIASFAEGVVASALPNEAPKVFSMERYYSAPQSQSLDPPVRVGDVLRFRWNGEVKPSGAVVEIAPQESKKSFQSLGWEVYSHPKDDPTSAFSVIPLRSGSVELPALALKNARGEIEGFTQPLRFEVEPAVTPEEAKRKPPEYLPPLAMSFPKYKILFLSLLGLVLASTFAYVWVRFRKNRKPAQKRAPSVVRLPEDQEALETLQKLSEKAFWKSQQFKPHYFGVSEAVKRYIERRYGFEAAESTTRELLHGLQGQGLGRDRIEQLSRLFEKLDRVKFTDFNPASEECTEVVQEARSWILSTKRPVVQPGGVNAP